MRYSIEHYLTPDGRDLFGEWFDCLKSPVAKAQVAMRLDRVERGNFGDHKSVGGGVWELRIHISPGFRCIILLKVTGSYFCSAAATKVRRSRISKKPNAAAKSIFGGSHEQPRD